MRWRRVIHTVRRRQHLWIFFFFCVLVLTSNFTATKCVPVPKLSFPLQNCGHFYCSVSWGQCCRKEIKRSAWFLKIRFMLWCDVFLCVKNMNRTHYGQFTLYCGWSSSWLTAPTKWLWKLYHFIKPKMLHSPSSDSIRSPCHHTQLQMFYFESDASVNQVSLWLACYVESNYS